MSYSEWDEEPVKAIYLNEVLRICPKCKTSIYTNGMYLKIICPGCGMLLDLKVDRLTTNKA